MLAACVTNTEMTWILVRGMGRALLIAKSIWYDILSQVSSDVSMNLTHNYLVVFWCFQGVWNGNIGQKWIGNNSNSFYTWNLLMIYFIKCYFWKWHLHIFSTKAFCQVQQKPRNSLQNSSFYKKNIFTARVLVFN